VSAGVYAHRGANSVKVAADCQDAVRASDYFCGGDGFGVFVHRRCASTYARKDRTMDGGEFVSTSSGGYAATHCMYCRRSRRSSDSDMVRLVPGFGRANVAPNIETEFDATPAAPDFDRASHTCSVTESIWLRVLGSDTSCRVVDVPACRGLFSSDKNDRSNSSTRPSSDDIAVLLAMPASLSAGRDALVKREAPVALSSVGTVNCPVPSTTVVDDSLMCADSTCDVDAVVFFVGRLKTARFGLRIPQ
jgi:hypothetical protein